MRGAARSTIAFLASIQQRGELELRLGETDCIYATVCYSA